MTGPLQRWCPVHGPLLYGTRCLTCERGRIPAPSRETLRTATSFRLRQLPELREAFDRLAPGDVIEIPKGFGLDVEPGPQFPVMRYSDWLDDPQHAIVVDDTKLPEPARARAVSARSSDSAVTKDRSLSGRGGGGTTERSAAGGLPRPAGKVHGKGER